MVGAAFTASDICSIIKACKGSGVTELVLGDLKIGFGPKDHAWPEMPLPRQLNFKDVDSNQNASPTEIDQEEINYQLAIDDPVAWERQQLEGNDANG